MDYDVNFKCVLDTGEEIPKEAVKMAGVKFPDVHKNAKDMAVLSKSIREYNEDLFFYSTFLYDSGSRSIRRRNKFRR